MDIFSTNHLTAVVNSLQGLGPNSLLARFFPDVLNETAEEIHFDVAADVMGLAPFVSPVVEGKIMEEQGFTTKTFKPAYVKPKRAFEPSTAFKRMKGERIGGSLSPDQRMRAKVAEHMMIDREQIDNRMEWMAAQVLMTGAVTISGEKYPTQNVSFGRDAALTITLTAGNKWGDAGVKPLDSLQDWSLLMGQKSGSYGRNIIMTPAAWKVFRVDSDVQNRINVQRSLGQNPTMGQDAITQTGLTFIGTIDSYNIWLYQGLYKDDSGTITDFLTDGTVLMVGAMMGKQIFGAIKDEEAGLQAISYFSKSWLEKDPSVRLVMTQSAPLVVPYRPNASLAATVI